MRKIPEIVPKVVSALGGASLLTPLFIQTKIQPMVDINTVKSPGWEMFVIANMVGSILLYLVGLFPFPSG